MRKAYRKLALLYHPDRNSGREEECVPKFQAIQAANEVLGDANTKQKYDTDRRKAGLFPVGPTGPTFNPRQAAPGNPYAANSAYPPPPRRTQPGVWPRGPGAPPAAAPGAPPPSGADRFSNFPRAAPTARKDPGPDRAAGLHKAWQNMGANQGPQGFNPPPPRAQPPPQPPPPQQARPRPQPPPRQDTKMPTEEQIRAGMKYRNIPRFDPETVQAHQNQWQQFRQANPTAQPPRPNLSRTNSMKTPNKQGFNPNMPGSDEKPSSSHHVHRNRSADFGRPPQPGVRPPPPPPSGPPHPAGATPTTPTPRSPVSPRSQRPFADPTRPNSSRMPNDQVPYSEGNRNRTPYTSFIHERTDLGDGLKRSSSVRDTTKLDPGSAAPGRARSTSPLGRQRASDSHVNGSSQQKPFVVYSDSEDSDANMTQTPEEVDASEKQRPGTAPTTNAPFNRPKKTPAPRNRSAHAATANGTDSDAEQPDMQQKSDANMYDTPFPSLRPLIESGGQTSCSRSTLRARRTWSTAGRWALPSSVNPFSKPMPKLVAKRKASAVPETFVTAADPIYTNSREDERNAYLHFQSDLRNVFEEVPGTLDMDVFLKLVSTARRGLPCDNGPLDIILLRLLEYFPLVGTSQNDHADDRRDSFTFPNNERLFTPTSAKSRSEENFNTNFSPEGWSGAFKGEPDYFAPPTSTGRKQPSPNRRTTRTPNQQPRSATMDVPSAGASQEEVPVRPWGSDGASKEPSTQPGPGEVRFSQEEWAQTFKDSSWTWQPPPRQSSPVKGGATPAGRKPSQARKVSKAAGGVNAQSRSRSEGAPGGDDGAGEGDAYGAHAYDGEPMDIDDSPPTAEPAEPQMQTTDKGARLYSVPPSTWRQRQEQKTAQSSGTHRKASSATHRAPTDTGAKLNTNLDDLRNVEPIAKTAPGAAGLGNFSGMSTTLPFPSEASRSVPASATIPSTLELPQNPRLPPEPPRLTKQSWQTYAKAFGDYCIAFHNFNATMLRHFDVAEKRAEGRFMTGTNWLEATGDTSGVFGEQKGFASYAAETTAMERSREYWNVGCERHTEGMKGFEKVRERVRKLAADGLLPEV